MSCRAAIATTDDALVSLSRIITYHQVLSPNRKTANHPTHRVGSRPPPLDDSQTATLFPPTMHRAPYQRATSPSKFAPVPRAGSPSQTFGPIPTTRCATMVAWVKKGALVKS